MTNADIHCEEPAASPAQDGDLTRLRAIAEGGSRKQPSPVYKSNVAGISPANVLSARLQPIQESGPSRRQRASKRGT